MTRWLRACSLVLAILAIIQATGQVFALGGFNVVVNRVESAAFPQVTTYVTVSDANGLPIPALQSSDFEVVENGIATSATVTSTASTTEPIAIAIAVDLSGSMLGRPLSNTVDALNTLIGQLGPADEISLVTFNNKVQLIVPPTTDKTQATAAVNQFKAVGETALWDGIHEAVTALSARAAGRQAILVVTDGQDTRSVLKLKDVVDEAVNSHLPVFSMGFGAVDQNSLESLAQLTGGESHVLPKTEELSGQFSALLDRLRQQYVVSYVSPGKADGAQHQVSVQVNYRNDRNAGQGNYTPPPGSFTVALQGITDGQHLGTGLPVHLTSQFPDRAAVVSVDYLLDSNELKAVTIAPFDYVWTPGTADQGQHTLMVRATDANKQTSEASVKLEVDPAIGVSIVEPKLDATIAGTTTLQADVTSLGTLQTVDFLIDGSSVGKLQSGPFNVDWNSASLPAGDHTLKVVATNADGQSADASRVFHVRVGINWGLFVALAAFFMALAIILPMSVRSRRARTATTKAATQLQQPLEPGLSPEATAWLVLESGGVGGGRWPVGGEPVNIGRQRSANQVILSGSEISRRQGVVQRMNGQFVYVNLSQSAPVRINSQPVSGQQSLNDGDRIEIGSFVLRFVTPKATASDKNKGA